MLKPILSIGMCLLFLVGGATAYDKRKFTTKDGKTYVGKLMKYSPTDKLVLLDIKRKTPLADFTEADQKYIMDWYVAQGFILPTQLRIELDEQLWARRRWKKNTIPYWLEPLKMEGKETPNHTELLFEGYEEYVVVEYTATGFEIKLRNKNSFPLENITVAHKIYYEQEEFIRTEDIVLSAENDYTDTTVKQTVKSGTEHIKLMEPNSELNLYSAVATLVNYEIERTVNLTTEEGEEDEDGNISEGSTSTDYGDTIEGFGEWDDSNRDREGKLIGIWVKISSTDANGKTVTREVYKPDNLPQKVSWDLPPEPAAEPAAETTAEPGAEAKPERKAEEKPDSAAPATPPAKTEGA
ncbi:MAG: hypothetical protein K9M45_08000 [Kiritimatiellales bacterium]|nr:hypothetical protein [Kiritimatiellales bacterium]